MPAVLRPLLALAAAVIALAAPATAVATTTVSVDDCGPATPAPDCTTLVLEGDGADSWPEIWPQEFNGPPTLVEVTNFVFDNAIEPKAGSGCVKDTAGSRVYVRCPELTTDVDQRRVRAVLGGGADNFMTFVPHGGGIRIDGGPGIDSLDAYAGSTPATVTYPAELIGGADADSLSGDEGADSLDGGADGDTLSGRGGSDSLAGGSEGDTLSGGDGVDSLKGGAGDDGLAGGDGVDDLDGDEGADGLAGGAGDDSLDGGAGNDSFESGAGAAAGRDVIAGGTGVDSVTYQTESYALTAITLDDVANDGNANPGSGASIEQDNVRSDVENVTTANGGARTSVVGTDARNELTALGDRNTIAGGGGHDLIVATCYPNCIDGGDTVDGGAGNDDIRTGDGADVISGGPGEDEIYADNCSSFTCSEPDRIDVVDGARDDVYCGGGGDVVRADPVDQLLMCDHVTIVGAVPEQPGGPAPATATPPAAVGRPAPPPAPAVQTARRCRVPKLRGASLPTARKRLKRAGCRLGKVRRPRGAARRLVVKRQSRRAGRSVPLSTKVNVTLRVR